MTEVCLLRFEGYINVSLGEGRLGENNENLGEYKSMAEGGKSVLTVLTAVVLVVVTLHLECNTSIPPTPTSFSTAL